MQVQDRRTNPPCRQALSRRGLPAPSFDQNPVQGAGQEERDPYWCRPWPAAVALAEWLQQRPELVRGKRVADLGAGLGIAGIAAALAGVPGKQSMCRSNIVLMRLLDCAWQGRVTAPVA